MHLQLVPPLSSNLKVNTNVWEPLVRTQTIRRIAPILNIKEEKIQKAFLKLRDNKEVQLLTSLLSSEGSDFLRALPELAEFPEPEPVLEAFLEDYMASEDPLIYDEDLMGDEEDVQDVLQATEQTRLLRMVLYFWHLVRVGGRELAKDTMVDLLHALALHQLLKTKGMTELQVRFHSHTLTLPLSFRTILQNTKISGSTGALNGVHELVKEKVLLTMEDEEPVLVARAVKEAQGNVDRVLRQDRGEIVSSRGFANLLLEDEMAESLAEIVLDACPPPTKKKQSLVHR